MSKLRVMTLNINTGHGPHGDFREDIAYKHLVNLLDDVAAQIEDSDADVVCLQEVDFRWARTHSINQAEYLRKKTGYPYLHGHAHHHSVLPDRLRELIRLPISTVFNRDTGTAILSRHPFKSVRHYNFGQSFSRRGNPTVNYWARLLNESKGYSFVEVEIDGQRLGVLSLHLLNDIIFQILDTFGRTVRGETFTRVWQVEKLLEHVEEWTGRGGLPLVVAGDFNTVPREGQLHFSNSKRGDPDDYRRDMTTVLLRESGLLRTVSELSGEGQAQDLRQYFTYPAVMPDRVLDYVFVTEPLQIKDLHVLAHPVSDHLAVQADVSW